MVCPRCTFLNLKNTDVCEVCNFQFRPVAVDGKDIDYSASTSKNKNVVSTGSKKKKYQNGDNSYSGSGLGSNNNNHNNNNNDDDHANTQGLMPLLKQVMQKQHSRSQGESVIVYNLFITIPL